MEKSTIMLDLFERLGKLEDWRKEKKEKDKPEKPEKKNKKPTEDEEVCPECGSNLFWVEEGIVYCEKCKEYFEHEESES